MSYNNPGLSKMPAWFTQHLYMAEAPLNNSSMHLRVPLRHSLQDEESAAVAFRSYFLELLWATPNPAKTP